MTTIETRIARDLETILDLAEKNGTLGRLKSVAIYFDEVELRAIVKSLRQVIPDVAQAERVWHRKDCPFCGSPDGQYSASLQDLPAAFFCKGCGINAAQPPAAPVETKHLQCERCGEVAIATGTLCDDCAELSIPHNG